MIELNNILANLGIEGLNAMQQSALQLVEQGRSVQILSPTGTGKTLAYLLPSARRVNAESPIPQLFVVLPTRELALQSEDVFRKMRLSLRSVSLYGGRPAMEEHRRLREVSPQVIFSTPGRLLDHLGKGNVDAAGARILVMDEFDKCLELGFQEEVDNIAACFAQVGQVVLLSATDTDAAQAFLQKFRCITSARGISKVDFLSNESVLPSSIAVSIVRSPRKDKLDTLAHLVSHLGQAQTIVFVSHRESADRVGHFLAESRFSVAVYHGGLEQEQRERALYRFRAGAVQVLVATDLAARGLDIPAVIAIIHYHLPQDATAFVHRSGRSGRWDADGHAYLMVGPEELVPEFVEGADELDVEAVPVRPHQTEWEVLYIGRGKKDKLSRGDVVGFLCKKGGIRSTDLGRVDVMAHIAYAAVRRGVTKKLLQAIAGEKIKGMRTLIEVMKSR